MPDRAAAASPNEAQLIARARSGEIEAFGELVASHEARVLRLAWRLLGNREDARDAAQEAFLRAFRARRRLDPERDPAPWLLRITVNVCRTMLRRRHARRVEPLDEAASGSGGGALEVAPGQEQRLVEADARRAVHGALRGLTPKERAVFVLRDLEERSGDEVASALRCTHGTVRSHLSRARAKVACHLAALKEVLR